MKRVRKIIFNGLTIASFILAAVTLAMYVRGQYALEWLQYNSQSRQGGWEHAVTISALCAASGIELHLSQTRAHSIWIQDGPFVWRHLSGKHDSGWWISTSHNTRSTADAYASDYGFYLPYWLILIVSMPAPGVWVWCRRRSGRRARLGLCPICGYDLRASKDRCPECGTPIPAGTIPHGAP